MENEVPKPDESILVTVTRSFWFNEDGRLCYEKNGKNVTTQVKMKDGLERSVLLDTLKEYAK